MNKFMKFSVVALFSTLALSTQANVNSSWEGYAKAGLLGVGAGIGYNVNEKLTTRLDFSTLGSISRNFTEDEIKYDAKLKANITTLAFDYFPTSTAFRLTAGLGLNQVKLSASGKPTTSGTINFNGQDYTFNTNDSVQASVKYPSVMPYVGLGYGHNAQAQDKGFGFTFDVGVYVGKPKTTLSISDSLRQTMKNAGRTEAQINSDISAERAKVEDTANKIKVIPTLNLGVVYHF